MRQPGSVRSLENLGRVRLSASFFMRDFLASEISQIYRIPNIPDEPDLAIEAGRHLCKALLEPLQNRFGRLAIRSAYRSCEINALGNEHNHNCARNESNYASHIWDRRDAGGCIGATACIVVPRFADYVESGGDWQSMAWWVHDHLPYSRMQFFPKLTAFNLAWHERPERTIYSYIAPRGWLTKPGMDNHEGDHADRYAELGNL